MTEIGEDEGILGNDFAMAHQLTVRPHEAAVYLPAAPRSGTDDMGEHLPYAVRSVAEIRKITEEAFAVRAAERLTLAPQTVSQARVTISAMSTGGTVMLKEGPSQLGLCPVRGVAEVNRDTNSGPRPVEVALDQVVALAERVSESEGMENGDDAADPGGHKVLPCPGSGQRILAGPDG